MSDQALAATTPETKHPGGRPSDFTIEIAEAICNELAEGKSLKSICARDDMPSQATVFRWLAKQENREFREMYARAREAQVEVYAAEITEISDDSSRDTILDERGNERPDNEWINRSRLRVDTRKWLMSKLAPRKYGDRIDHVIRPGAPEQLSDAELAQIAAPSVGKSVELIEHDAGKSDE